MSPLYLLPVAIWYFKNATGSKLERSFMDNLCPRGIKQICYRLQNVYNIILDKAACQMFLDERTRQNWLSSWAGYKMARDFMVATPELNLEMEFS